jgi:hypothetical protein
MQPWMFQAIAAVLLGLAAAGRLKILAMRSSERPMAGSPSTGGGFASRLVHTVEWRITPTKVGHAGRGR